MKITGIRTQIVNLNFRNAVIVRVETNEGITGIAETVMKRRTHTIATMIEDVARTLIGEDPTEIERLWESMYRDSFWVGGPLHSTALSAIDCALWDILGKAAGMPVYKLLGGATRREIPAYCHCAAGETPEEFAAHAKACKERGYGALKTTLPLFYGGKAATGGMNNGYSGTGGTVSRHWRETEYLAPSVFHRIREFFLAAREACGPDMGLAVDCHGRLNAKDALRLCRAVEDLNLLFVEEPVPPEHVDELRMVQSETSVPIAAGERWATIYGVRPFLEKHAVDYLQCDLVNCGGITGMKKIAAMAEAHSIGMAPHNPNGPLATVMNLHYAASIPNFFILETIGSEADERLMEEMVARPVMAHGGVYALPEGPGFGVELVQAALDAHPYVPCAGYR